MATIISAQSGNWEDGTTWVGGVVPTAVDDVIIESNSKITCTVTTTHTAQITLRGELSIADGVDIKIGVKGSLEGHVLFAGGTLSGSGKLSVNKGSYKTQGEAWSYVKEAVSITSSGASYADAVFWDLQKLSYTSTGDFKPLFKYNGVTANTWRMQNCVIENCVVEFGATGGVLPTGILITSCTFRNCKGINTGGSGASSKPITFESCVFQNCGEFKFFATGSETTFAFGFIDTCYLSSAAAGVIYDACFITRNIVEGGYLLGVSSSAASQVKNSIAYTPTYSGGNMRFGKIATITNNFFEIYSGDSANGILLDIIYTNTIKNNVFTGSACAMTAPLQNGVVNFEVSNNTNYASGDVNPASTLITFERWYPPVGSSMKLANNLFVSPQESGTTIYLTNYTKPFTATIALDFDYNAKHGFSGWYDTELFTNATGQHLVDNAEPQFLDSSRTVASWCSQNIAATTYEDITAYFASMNGYDAATQAHTGASIDAGTTFTDMLTWLREGYTPQNMELATAGEGGTYVGAVMPKEAPSGLKVVFNGQTVARAFFNGQPIALDKIKFLQS